MFQAGMDLVRVVFAMGLLYVLLPVLALRAGDKWRENWSTLIVPAALRTVLVLEFACILLGGSRLCFPGSVFSIYALWLAASVMFASRRRWVYDGNAWRSGYGKLWRWVERRRLPSHILKRVISFPQTAFLLGLILIGGMAQFLWYPLNNYRFLSIQTYARAVSLQTLVAGNDWNADGSVAFLAPVVFLSGLDAATVIRLSAPVFFALLMGAAAWCAFQYSNAIWCSTFAAGILWMCTRFAGLDSAGEPGSAEIGALFLVMAAALMRRSPGYAACAAIVAWLIEPVFPTVLPAILACIFAALLAYWCYARAPRPARQIGATAFLLILGVSFNSALRSAPPDGPYEYEASARMAAKIAREFPRNRWLVVSPVHEAAYLYGRGWHVELADFVSKYTTAMVASPEFRFPYESANMFVFVEKRPLAQKARIALPGSPGSAFFYSTKSGRASLEFQAARLMAAYSSSHSNSRVFFENEDLIIYCITR
jgi:hypothetical protein